MFLNLLTDQQKKAFLAIAMKIVSADRHLDPKERKTIEAMRYEMGLWAETDIPRGSIEELAKPFDTHQSKVIALLEGIALALADNEFHGEEQKILRGLALVFGMSEKKATDIEAWVLKYYDLQKQAYKLMTE